MGWIGWVGLVRLGWIGLGLSQVELGSGGIDGGGWDWVGLDLQ